MRRDQSPGASEQHARILHPSGSQILRVSKAPIIALNPLDLTYFALSYDGARIYLAGPPIENMQHFPKTTRSRVYRGGAIIVEGLALPAEGCIQADPQTDPPKLGNCW
jgi:hypothetical protein